MTQRREPVTTTADKSRTIVSSQFEYLARPVPPKIPGKPWPSQIYAWKMKVTLESHDN